MKTFILELVNNNNQIMHTHNIYSHPYYYYYYFSFSTLGSILSTLGGTCAVAATTKQPQVSNNLTFPAPLLWRLAADRNEECGGDVLLLGGGGSGARLRSRDVLQKDDH